MLLFHSPHFSPKDPLPLGFISSSAPCLCQLPRQQEHRRGALCKHIHFWTWSRRTGLTTRWVLGGGGGLGFFAVSWKHKISGHSGNQQVSLLNKSKCTWQTGFERQPPADILGASISIAQCLMINMCACIWTVDAGSVGGFCLWARSSPDRSPVPTQSASVWGGHRSQWQLGVYIMM